MRSRKTAPRGLALPPLDFDGTSNRSIGFQPLDQRTSTTHQLVNAASARRNFAVNARSALVDRTHRRSTSTDRRRADCRHPTAHRRWFPSGRSLAPTNGSLMESRLCARRPRERCKNFGTGSGESHQPWRVCRQQFGHGPRHAVDLSPIPEQLLWRPATEAATRRIDGWVEGAAASASMGGRARRSNHRSARCRLSARCVRLRAVRASLRPLACSGRPTPPAGVSPAASASTSSAAPRSRSSPAAAPRTQCPPSLQRCPRQLSAPAPLSAGRARSPGTDRARTAGAATRAAR